MKRSVILLITLTLTITSPQYFSSAFSQKSTSGCSQRINNGGLAAIIGQSKALGRKDFDSAFAYASQGFRKNSSVSTFAQVINSGFPYLLTARNIQITDCVRMKQFYQYQVSLDSQGALFSLTYLLQPQSKSQSLSPNKTGFGIVAAQLNETQIAGSPEEKTVY
jgi:hypothetical protein